VTMETIKIVSYDENKNYKVTEDNTHYHYDTSDNIIYLLQRLKRTKERVRFHWGDSKTGLDWGDIYDVTGTVNRSTGPIHSPILIHNSRSHGGHGISTHCIVKVTTSTKPHTVLYEHPNYHTKQ